MTAAKEMPTRPAPSLSRGASPIKVFRMATGMSAATMAMIARLDVQRVEAIERGEIGTDAEMAQIARALNIPFEMLGL